MTTKTKTTVAKTKTASAQAQAVTALRGTAAQLAASGIKLNGQFLDASAVAHLRKYQFGNAIAIVGHEPKPQGQKGKSAEILELSDAPGFEFVNPSMQAEAVTA